MLNIMQICEMKYPKKMANSLITFRNPYPYKEILIDEWNVDGVARPLEDDLLSESAIWEKPYSLMQLNNEFSHFIKPYMDTIAQTKLYDSALSIVSYANSTNPSWQEEARVFMAWRDSVFSYSLDILRKIESNEMEAPSLDEFISGMPSIQWPG